MNKKINRYKLGISPLVTVVVIAVTSVSVLGVAYFFNNENAVAGESGNSGKVDYYRVVPKTFDLTVISEGELEADDEIEVKSGVEGKSTIVFVVDEGVTVKKGDLLVKLSDDEIKKSIQDTTLKLVQATADYEKAMQDVAISQSEASSSEDKAKLTYDMAVLDLQKWEAGTVIQTREDLRVAFEKSIETYIHRKKEYANSQELYKKEFVSGAELYKDKIAFTDAESNKKKTALDKETYEKYTHPKEEQKFNSDKKQAKKEWERTVERNLSKMAQKKSIVINRQRSLEITRKRLENYKKQENNTEIFAPRAGMVVYATSGRRGRDRDRIERGRQLYFNQSIITLPNISQMTAVIKVHEALVGQVKVGQDVMVTISANNNGMPIKGTVKSIASIASGGGWINPDLREYEVKVKLPKLKNTSLKPNMRCLGKILHGKVENKIAVPVHAVHTLGRSKICYVRLSNGYFEPRVLKLGKRSETYVEVLTGLKEGETISLSKPKISQIKQTKKIKSKST